MEHLRGIVSHCYYSSPKFSAGRLRKPNGEEVRFAGEVFLRVGEPIAAKGRWVRHPDYGRQFEIASVAVDENLDVAGLATWLSLHPAAVGIGPVRARRIAESFGHNFEEALMEQPEKIAAVAGVPVQSIRNLAKEWAARAGFNAVATQLAAVGLTKHQIESLIEACGSTVVQALKDDPYSVLGRVPGFGFKRIDDIARNSYGVAKNHERRIDAGIVHCLKQALNDGSTCLSRADLCIAAEPTLFLDSLDAEDLICDRMDALINGQALWATDAGCTKFVSLPWVASQEGFVGQFLETGNDPNPHGEDLGGELPATLDEDQLEAVLLCMNHRIVVMSGGAGTGKTTTTKAIADVYQRCGKTVLLACPTGKAARRMSQVSGLPAQTIHRLLEYSPMLERFTRDADNPIVADAVIIDEVSMVDLPLAYHLFQAIGPQTAVLLVGDHHQLPPVGPGALLRDCISQKLVPTKILSHCHRQAGVLKLNCSAILDGNVVFEKSGGTEAEPPSWIVDARHDGDDPSKILKVLERLWLQLIPQWGYDRIINTQILSGMHRGIVGTRNINFMLQRLHQKSLGVEVAAVEESEPSSKREPTIGSEPLDTAATSTPGKSNSQRFYLGDKVICTRNNYQLDICNGMQGLVKSVKPLVIEFEGRDVEIPADKKDAISLAYCLTPHKCQGSEWSCIVVVCSKEQWVMHSRNWLYTACTRARGTCVIVGDRPSIEGAARRVKPNQRKTLLGLGM